MKYSQAELLRLLEFIEEEVFSADDYDEAKKRWKVLKIHLREKSLEELRRMLNY